MEHTEKTLSVQEIFSGHVVRLTLDKVELENGRSAMREVVHHRGGACIAERPFSSSTLSRVSPSGAPVPLCPGTGIVGTARRQAGGRGGPL